MNTGYFQSGGTHFANLSSLFQGLAGSGKLLLKDSKDSIGGIAGLKPKKEWVRAQVFSVPKATLKIAAKVGTQSAVDVEVRAAPFLFVPHQSIMPRSLSPKLLVRVPQLFHD
jgi:hypothetical protein